MSRLAYLMALLEIEQFRPAPPPQEPATAEARQLLIDLRDEALAFIEEFRP